MRALIRFLRRPCGRETKISARAWLRLGIVCALWRAGCIVGWRSQRSARALVRLWQAAELHHGRGLGVTWGSFEHLRIAVWKTRHRRHRFRGHGQGRLRRSPVACCLWISRGTLCLVRPAKVVHALRHHPRWPRCTRRRLRGGARIALSRNLRTLEGDDITSGDLLAWLPLAPLAGLRASRRNRRRHTRVLGNVQRIRR